MRFKSELVITAAVLALGLAACSKTDNTDTASAPAEASASANTTLSAMASDASAMGDKIKEKTAEAGDALKQQSDAAGDTLKQKSADASDQLKQKSAEAGAAMSDAGVTAKVKAALANDAGLSTLKLNVETKDGVVTLSGALDNAVHKDQVKKVAAGVEGVKSVDDQTTVK